MFAAHKAEQLVKNLQSRYQIDLEGLIKNILKYNPDFNQERFRDAFAFAAQAHDGQTRKQASLPYIIHPFETVKILSQIHADEPTLIAALLHDVPEDTGLSMEQIQHRYGKEVAYMVEGITKLSKVHYHHDMQQREIESMKKLFIHVAEDPRTMLIKLADRLHNMRTLEYMDVPEKRLRKARETLEIFTPIAKLLGIKEIQRELEDLCFKNLYPEEYESLKKKVQESAQAHAQDLQDTLSDTEKALKKQGLDAIVYSYQENLYHIFQRLQRENDSIDDLDFCFSLTVLLPDINSCYEALGVVHGLFKLQPGRFKDYISLPKANGYQSIHTTVFGHNGIPTKFCIRTNQMHFDAQYGIAASYFDSQQKAGRRVFTPTDPRSRWVEEVMEIQQDTNRQTHYLDELKSYLVQDRVNVFTPRGDAIVLPLHATCIDFAYAIHTQVGNRAISALVNGNSVGLDYQLNKGDVVKIITTEYAKNPSYEWLAFSKTALARKKMQEYFKKESHASKVQAGRQMMQKEYDRAGLGLVGNLSRWKLQQLSKNYPSLHITSTEAMLVHLAEGNLSTLEVVNILYPAKSNTSDQLGPLATSRRLAKQKLTKLRLKVVCSASINFADLVNVIQKRNNQVILLSGDTKYNFFQNKIIYRAVMLVGSYRDISNICRDLERLPGVEKVERLFWYRKFFFFLGSIFTFMVWAIHPLLLYYITHQFSGSSSEIRLYSNIVLFAGLLLLVYLIFSLKQYTEKSFPELRETNRLWRVTYMLGFFALITVLLEVYLYKLAFDWGLVLLGLGIVFAYLTGHYLYYRDKKAI